MQTKDKERFIVKAKEGFTPEIGRLLSMMEYTRMTTIEAVKGLSTEQLDYRIDGKGNSIGCLLHHMACVEEVYQIITFEGRDPNEEELQKIELGLTLGEEAHEVMHSKRLDFYLEQLDQVRQNTWKRFKGMDDNWLDEISPFGTDHQANNYFRWFHVFEDELSHRGQIRLIRNHQQRNC
ncbi:DinB family protein [Halobacillus sp. BBL2006]|uniref:DinB family protein n=1 Tax=Halobacillus sp. BBL2006 TaxID=1543706 RepID=UPI000543FE92|nr:DinB family protein [Halobacillus sp. BBL2006]KHE72970.1 hypothetical protein LD39_01730 [Halobacillus sp. BBL2006]